MLTVLPDVDLCIDVAGDQYAPTLRAGDIALVRSRPPLAGEIGVAFNGAFTLFEGAADPNTVVGTVVAVVRKLRRAGDGGRGASDCCAAIRQRPGPSPA